MALYRVFSQVLLSEQSDILINSYHRFGEIADSQRFFITCPLLASYHHNLWLEDSMPYVDLHSEDDYASIYYHTNAPRNNVSGFDPEKSTVIILHPYFLDSTWLDNQFGDPRLNDSFNLVAFDMRFSGRSTCRMSGRQDAWVNAADLAFCHQVCWTGSRKECLFETLCCYGRHYIFLPVTFWHLKRSPSIALSVLQSCTCANIFVSSLSLIPSLSKDFLKCALAWHFAMSLHLRSTFLWSFLTVVSLTDLIPGSNGCIRDSRSWCTTGAMQKIWNPSNTLLRRVLITSLAL